MMQRHRYLFAACAIAMSTTFVAGCGSSSSKDTKAAQTDATTAAAAADTTVADSVAPAAAATEAASSQAAATEPASKEPQKITVAYNSTGDFPEPNATLTLAKAAFEKANPGVTVELQKEVAADDPYHTKLQLRLQSGSDVPDVMFYSPNWVDADAAAGYLSPLDDGLAAWPDWMAQFPQAVRDGAKSADGKTYGVPMSANDIGIWYNKDTFKAAGLPENWEPKNWADLRSAAEAIKAKVPNAIPVHLYAGKASGITDAILKTFQPLLYGTGSTLYDFDQHKWVKADKGFLDAMTFVSDMYSAKLTAKTADVLSPNVWSFIGPWMKDTKLGFVPDGNWMSFAWVKGGPNEWPQWGDRLGIAAIPTQDGSGAGKITMALRGTVMVRSAKTDSPELAMKFIETVTNKENSLSIAVNSSQLAVRNDVAADPAYKNRPTVAEFTAMLQYAKYLPLTEENAKVETLLADLIEEVALGKMTPADSVKKYNDQIVGLVGADKFAA
jgi:multiple sugar transport system substrate-binding protein